MQTIPIFIISVLFFIGFLNVKIKYNKVINVIATTTFGIYLIHDNSYVREFLWKVLFKNALFSKDILLIPYSLCVIVVVFFICCLIELFRIYVLEKQYMIYINKLSDFIERKGNKVLSLLFLKVNKKDNKEEKEEEKCI